MAYPLLIRARALTGFAALVARHGGDAKALLSALDIPPSALDAPESTILLDRTIQLLEHTANTFDIPDFGLQLATCQDISILGPVAAIARHAQTVGEAFDAIRRYMPYHTPGGLMSTGPSPVAGHT
ncbi:MAG TPA: AraC family transcriptional regulator ligand-binding domain-containing protein, partial [Fluviicoccus sp.]|nr:AraC family transcriptional regulator ligand-binding domain-containing protein [Fluviicoccus sp.]